MIRRRLGLGDLETNGSCWMFRVSGRVCGCCRVVVGYDVVR
jgi:hypothetical protein